MNKRRPQAPPLGKHVLRREAIAPLTRTPSTASSSATTVVASPPIEIRQDTRTAPQRQNGVDHEEAHPQAPTRKLVLRGEAIAQLTPVQLGQVAGASLLGDCSRRSNDILTCAAFVG